LDVAVKSIKNAASEADEREFFAEIALMKEIKQHPNVVSLVGVCSAWPPRLVVEYAELGDLRSYLMEHRATETHGALLVEEDMLYMAWQVARGMEHLSGLRIVHRDLAA
jgi:serine/threonine protein kinase